MKRVILVLAMLLVPAALAAQEKDASVAANQQGSTSSTSTTSLAAHADDATTAPSPTLFSDASTGEPASATSAPQTSSTSTSTQSETPTRPPIQGSMVGYIDDPIVESQIRVRFDAAFDNDAPDRAEFFYAKCGCYRGLPSSQGLDPKAPGPPPGSAVIIPTSLNFQQLYFYGEFAPVHRFSVFTEIPLRWIQAQGLFTPQSNGPFPNEGGLSDVMAGFKFAAVASESTYLTFQFRGYFPSGDASKGLGTNHYSVEPELLLYHRFSPALTLEGQVGDWHPIGGSAGVPTTSSNGFAGDIFTYGIGPSYRLISRDRIQFAPVVELVGWSVLGGLQTPTQKGQPADASGTNIVNLKVGFRTNVGLHSSFYVGFGHSLTHDIWYKEIVRAEYRYAF
jgi:hypothetical protein